MFFERLAQKAVSVVEDGELVVEDAEKVESEVTDAVKGCEDVVSDVKSGNLGDAVKDAESVISDVKSADENVENGVKDVEDVVSDVKGGNYSDAENNDDDAGSAANSPKVNSGSIKNSEDAISATNSPDNINSGVKDIENIFEDAKNLEENISDGVKDTEEIVSDLRSGNICDAVNEVKNVASEVKNVEKYLGSGKNLIKGVASLVKTKEEAKEIPKQKESTKPIVDEVLIVEEKAIKTKDSITKIVGEASEIAKEVKEHKEFVKEEVEIVKESIEVDNLLKEEIKPPNVLSAAKWLKSGVKLIYSEAKAKEIQKHSEVETIEIIENIIPEEYLLESEIYLHKEFEWKLDIAKIDAFNFEFPTKTIPINVISKIKVLKDTAIHSSRKIKMKVNEENMFFSVSHNHIKDELPLHYVWFARVILNKLRSFHININSLLTEEQIHETRFKKIYIQGMIYKQSQHLKKWELRYVVINNEGLFSFNNNDVESFAIISDSVSEIWTRFETYENRLIVKVHHKGMKTEFALPMTRLLEPEGNWLYGMYRLMYGIK